LSKHYQTNEPLPGDLIDKKIAIKTLNEASLTLRQICFGTFDFLLHTAFDKTFLDMPQENKIYSINQLRQNMKKTNDKVDTQALFSQIKPLITLVPQMERTNPGANFGHLFGGYESQYYGYLWSLVYSCDLFDQFLNHGVMNQELGMKYRKLILAPGGSLDSADSLRTFLGREPNDEAYLR